MGFSHSAYHFYGVHIPESQWADESEGNAGAEGERLGEVIEGLGLGNKAVQVGYLTAGDYDRDMLFLCIKVTGLDAEVSLGEFRLSPAQSQLPDIVNWNHALWVVAQAAGYPDPMTYGWITVPDLS